MKLPPADVELGETERRNSQSVYAGGLSAWDGINFVASGLFFAIPSSLDIVNEWADAFLNGKSFNAWLLHGLTMGKN